MNVLLYLFHRGCPAELRHEPPEHVARRRGPDARSSSSSSSSSSSGSSSSSNSPIITISINSVVLWLLLTF